MESIDFTMWQSIFWYVMGILSYKIVAKVLNISAAGILFQEALLSSLALLRNASDNYELSNEFSHKKTIEFNKERADSELSKEKLALKYWQRLAVMNIRNSTPRKLKAIIDFKDWDGAIRYLNKKE